MQIKHSLLACFYLFILLNFCIVGYSQKLVTYKTENQPLNLVLSKITSMTNVRFAFDDDFLSRIAVSINVNGISIEDFLKQLSSKYPITYRLIGSTWVIYKEEKKVTAKQKTNIHKKVEQVAQIAPENEEINNYEEPQEGIEEQVAVKTKAEYTVVRLWDLKGFILDSETGNRILNCILYLDEYTHPVTNELGYFFDETVGTGEVRAVVAHNGYYPLDTIFKVTDGEAIVIHLKPLVKAGNSHNKYFSGFPVKMENNSNSIFLTHNTGSNPGGKEISDYANFFSYVPGINADNVNSAIEIRGGSYSPDNIQLDGVPLLNLFHLGGLVSAVNNDFIHQSFLSRGGLGVDQQTNSSGLISLIGKTGFVKPQVNITATLLDATLYAGIPLSGKISFSAALRKSIVDKWPNYYYKNLVSANVTIQSVSDSETTGDILNVFNNYYDFNAMLTYRPNNQNEVNLVFNSGSDNQERDFSITNNNNYFITSGSKWKSRSFGINWKYVTPNNWVNTFNASSSFLDQNEWNYSGIKEYVKDGDFASLVSSNFSEFQTVHLKWRSLIPTKRFSHVIGAELNYLNSAYLLKEQYSSLDGVSGTFVDAKNDENATTQVNLFYQTSYKPLKWMELTLGMRGLYDVGNKKIYPQPRLSVGIAPVRQLNFYYRFGQEVLSLFKSRRFNTSFSSAPFWMLPEGSEHVLQSWQHLAGGSFSNNALLFNIEAFRNVDSGLSAFFPVTNYGGPSNEAFRLISGEGIRQGVDCMVQYQQALFHHSLSYSFTNFKEKYLSLNGNNFFPAINQPVHRLQITELIRYSGWIGSARFTVMSGISYPNLYSSVSSLSFSRLPVMYNLDLSITKQLTFAKTNIETGIGLQNVFNGTTAKSVQYYELFGVSKNILLKTIMHQPAIVPSFFVSVRLK
jgi:hypothetical protein